VNWQKRTDGNPYHKGVRYCQLGGKTAPRDTQYAQLNLKFLVAFQ